MTPATLLPLPPAQPAPPVEDARTSREILLDLEKKLAPLLAQPEPPHQPRIKTLPKRLSRKAEDALTNVLDDWAALKRRGNFEQLVEAVNQIEPDALYKGGETNASIRAFCAQRCGID